MDNILFMAAKNVFEDEIFVSTARIQRFFKVSYFQARVVLDMLIQAGFCEEQVGSIPCRVIANEKN